MNPTIEALKGDFVSVFASDVRTKKSARILTDRLIRRSSDCAPLGTTGCLDMPLVPSVTLADEEKLSVLRRLDQFRQWRSLDEKRYCLVCGEMITGRQIQVIGETHGKVQLRLSCPTKHCNATVIEWVRPTDAVLIRIAMIEAEYHRLCLIIRAGRAMQSYQSKQHAIRSDQRRLSRDPDSTRRQQPETRGWKTPSDS